VYEEQQKKAEKAAFVKTARERIKLASKIVRRPGEDLRAEERVMVFRVLIARLMKVDVSDEDDSVHLAAELIRAIFDVDKMLYYVAPEWWRPRKRARQWLGTKKSISPKDVVGWGGVASSAALRSNYYITEDSDPAPEGASLGWLLQLDGDDHRNAFLNAPWVKAVIPIRPGKEEAALNWLQLAHVEGSADLDATYGGNEPELAGKTIAEALEILATKVTSVSGADIGSVLATETVYETGFDPLEGGFRATGTPFEIFDQWIEVLPTDQVVAVEYGAGGPSQP
jgi:hypothetical protein